MKLKFFKGKLKELNKVNACNQSQTDQIVCICDGKCSNCEKNLKKKKKIAYIPVNYDKEHNKWLKANSVCNKEFFRPFNFDSVDDGKYQNYFY